MIGLVTQTVSLRIAAYDIQSKSTANGSRYKYNFEVRPGISSLGLIGLCPTAVSTGNLNNVRHCRIY